MSAAPFDTGLIITRLRAPLLPGTLRLVGGSADYASVSRLQDFPAPCAYVLLGRERGIAVKTGQNLPGQQYPIAQMLAVTFAVAMVFRNYRQLEGDELRNELRDQVGAVRNRLLGWTPPVPGGRACDLLQGDLVAYDAGIALWTDIWRTQQSIKPEIAP
jgi:hypothetical protein